MSFVKDFKAFVLRGSVVDLAVAVIIGGAFGKIVTSFVNDILMPPIGLLLGGANFKNFVIILKPAQQALMNGDVIIKPAVAAVTWNYGIFIQNIVDFLIIALVIFWMIKTISKLERKQEVPATPPPPPEPSNEEKILAEIRDLLKKQG